MCNQGSMILINESIRKKASYFREIVYANSYSSDFNDSIYVNKISLFFLKTYSIKKEKEVLVTVDKLIEFSIADFARSPNNLSWLTGGSGIINILVYAFYLTRKKKYLDRAADIVHGLSSNFRDSDYVGDSFYAGRTGYIMSLLLLYCCSHDSNLLIEIDNYTRKVISTALPDGQCLAWHNPYELVEQPSCSFGYGSSGIGYVFNCLGHFFNHPPFLAIAQNSFNYTNKHCIDDTSGLWKDSRVDFKKVLEYINHLKTNKNQDDSWKNSDVVPNYSIEHGIFGVAFSQLDKIGEETVSKLIPPRTVLSFEEIVQLGHLYIDLFNTSKNCEYLDKSYGIIKELNSHIQTDRNRIEIALLEISLLKNESGIFPFTVVLNYGQNYNREIEFCSFTEIYKLINSRIFKVTEQYLDQIGAAIHEIENFAVDPIVFMEERLANVKADPIQMEIINQVFSHELEFWTKAKVRMGNPNFYIEEMVALNNRMELLNIPDHRLLGKVLKISEQFSRYATYYNIKDIRRIKKLPSKTITYFQYDLVHGLREVQLGLTEIVLNKFLKPNLIEGSYLQIFLYCQICSQGRLGPLIDFTKSNNKETLIQRLPFLFTYQIRLLLADGMLEVVTDTSLAEKIKLRLLKIAVRVVKWLN